MKLNDDGNLDIKAFTELVKDLENDIRDENNKASGKAKPAKLAKAILAPGIKRKDALMGSAYTDDNGIKWVVDGYRICGFFEDLDLPEVLEEDRDRWFKLDNLVNLEYDDEPMELPTVGDLKAAIKIAKAEDKKAAYTFKYGNTFSAEYLLDFLEGLSNVKVYTQLYNGKLTDVSPIRIEADNGVGILLGIKTKTEMPEGINYM